MLTPVLDFVTLYIDIGLDVILTKVQYPLTCMFQINISNFISQGPNPQNGSFSEFCVSVLDL